MDNNSLGISFAPTADQAEMGPRRGPLEGLPQAIKILSLHMPRILGARAPVSSALVNPSAGAGGIDPYLSALFQTLAKTMSPNMPNAGGLPGGAAGGPMPRRGPVYAPPYQPSMPDAMPSKPPMPETHWQGPGTSGGTAGPGPGQLPDRPEFPQGRRLPGYGGRY